MRMAHLPSRALLKISGEDKDSFLQGLITNDIQRLQRQKAIYTCLLTPQGKYLYDFFVVKEGKSYLIDCEANIRDALLKKLKLHKLRSKVELEEAEDHIYALWEENTPSGYTDPRLKALGQRVISADPLEVTHEESDFIYHCHGLGVPYHSQDLIPQKSIPLESNLDELQAIDWEKGCYMGQELTARTKHRGLVRKRLFPVKIQGEAPEFGAPLHWGDQKVGYMRSSSKDLGLALIKLEALEQCHKEKQSLTCGASQIDPYIPDWMTV